MRSSGLVEFDTVLAVARHRGFRVTATELGMSRSALSHAIAALEAKLACASSIERPEVSR